MCNIEGGKRLRFTRSENQVAHGIVNSAKIDIAKTGMDEFSTADIEVRFEILEKQVEFLTISRYMKESKLPFRI